MHRIFVLDDHVSVREGVRRLIAAEWPRVEAILFGQPLEMLSALGQQPPDLLIMDWTMPGMDGSSLIRETRRLRPNLPVLVYSMHAASAMGVQAIKAGAAGYISKDAPAAELIEAIRHVSQGKTYVSGDLGEALANAVANPLGQPHESLSGREMQVLIELAQGSSITEISERLHLSVKTVSTYKSRVQEKLGVKSVADIVRYAINHKLV